jgi:hypothetical protein
MSNYQINIEQARNGYIVRVGCWTLVFDNQVRMLAELARYFDNPDQVEREYREKYEPDSLIAKAHGLAPMNGGCGCEASGRAY